MIAVTVSEPSQIAEARREAATIARGQGFDEVRTGRIALVATELATNLVKHGGGGDLLAGAYEDGEEGGVELMALDRGRGMANVAACLADGYSSAGTPGQGLGAVMRQSSYVDIASWPGLGTAVLARVAAGGPEPSRPAPAARPATAWLPAARIGSVSVAKAGEEVCGDSCAVIHDGARVTICVADGLGHGQEAADASVEAVRAFHRFQGHQVPTLLDYVHGGLRATRGAAVSIARVDPAAGKVVFAGIGNVSGVLATKGGTRRMVSMPGTAGYNARRIQAFDYPFEAGLVILHSDGLSSSWTLDRYPNLAAAHPALIAGILFRDHGRRRDDATVVVARWEPGAGAP
jgi:anti-sigma regulatory factor (Ser/Thr protein kinase)